MATKKTEAVDGVPAVDPAGAVFAPGAPTNTPGDMLQPMPEPEGGWPPDEFTGLDGRFVRDRFTGVRSRALD